MPDELTLAIGLVWGHLNARQFEPALQLTQGCLRLWPGNQPLILMQAYAAVELLEPLDRSTLAVLAAAMCRDWVSIIMRRAECHGQAPTGD